MQTRQRLGQALLARGDYPGARGALEAALADAEDVLAPGDLDIATLLNDLGMIGKYDGRFDDAAAHYARALPLAQALGEEGMVATLHHNLAGLAHSRGDYAGAEPHARRAIELNAALRGPDHPRVAGDEGELGEILAALGRLDEAEALVRGAAAKFAAAYGPEHVECAIARTSLGSILHRAGRPAEAEVEYRAGLAVREALTGREHPELAPTLINLATLLAERGDTDEAEALFRRALGVMDGRGDRRPSAARRLRAASRRPAREHGPRHSGARAARDDPGVSGGAPLRPRPRRAPRRSARGPDRAAEPAAAARRCRPRRRR